MIFCYLIVIEKQFSRSQYKGPPKKIYLFKFFPWYKLWENYSCYITKSIYMLKHDNIDPRTTWKLLLNWVFANFEHLLDNVILNKLYNWKWIALSFIINVCLNCFIKAAWLILLLKTNKQFLPKIWKLFYHILMILIARLP